MSNLRRLALEVFEFSGSSGSHTIKQLCRSQTLIIIFATLLVGLNVSFAQGRGDSDEPEAVGCGDQYDHNIALKFGREYRKALEARDYARLKQLKAEKDQANLWAKTNKGCKQGVAGENDGGTDNGEDNANGGNEGNDSSNPNLAQCERLNTALDNALASQCSYGGEAASCQEAGYAPVDPADIGLDASLFDLDGFHAELLFKDGEYTLSFRGTGGDGKLDLLDDIQDDIGQSQGFTTSQYVLAVRLANELDRRLGAENISFTGHSLGGGLATAAALAIQRPAIVYNPAGLHPDVAIDLNLDINDANDLVTVYYVEGEIVSAAQDLDPVYIPNPRSPFIPPYIRLDGPSAPGARHPLAPPSDEWWEQNQGLLPDVIEKPITYHYISTVIVSIREELEENDCPE